MDSWQRVLAESLQLCSSQPTASDLSGMPVENLWHSRKLGGLQLGNHWWQDVLFCERGPRYWPEPGSHSKCALNVQSGCSKSGNSHNHQCSTTTPRAENCWIASSKQTSKQASHNSQREAPGLHEPPLKFVLLDAGGAAPHQSFHGLPKRRSYIVSLLASLWRSFGRRMM